MGKALAMPKVTVDGQQIEVPQGATVLQACELAGTPAPVLTGVPRLDHREPKGPPSATDAKGRPLKQKDYQKALADYEEAKAFSFLSRYGECVVRVDPAAARALLLTEPASAEEASRFAAMQTALATCMPPDQSLEFSKVTLRGTVAINYYRLSNAAQTTGAAQ